MLKRAGRGHDPDGIKATLFGDCAVECPACPHPGKNLPEGWEKAPLAIRYVLVLIYLIYADGYLNSRRWIYALIITLDANFKLKLKNKGIQNDPPLGDGWGNWVASLPYRAYVKKYGHQVEVRLLSLLTAKILHHSAGSPTFVIPISRLSITRENRCKDCSQAGWGGRYVRGIILCVRMGSVTYKRASGKLLLCI